MLNRFGWVFVFLAGTAHAATLHVPMDYAEIQDAVVAAQDGDLVLVGPGRYTRPSEPKFVVNPLGKRIEIVSSDGPELTIIDSEGIGRGVLFRSGETTATRVAGFKVVGGSGVNYGGGMACDTSDPTISDCIITDNRSRIEGGGICCAFARPIIEGCRIYDNMAQIEGGGICSDYSAPLIRNNVIYNNHGQYFGGGVHLHGGSEATIVNNLIAGNLAGRGGAILCQGSSRAVVDHCTLVSNSAVDEVGGVYVEWLSEMEISNSIVWGNTMDQLQGERVTLDHCNVQGGWPGDGNINLDPNFVTRHGLPYLLAPGSPSIDAGTGADDGIDWAALYPAYGRVNTPAPDMGAFGGPENIGWLDYLP